MANYKKIPPYIIYSLTILLVSFGEKCLLGHYFSLGLIMAYAYRRKNLLVILPVYLISVSIAQWRVEGLLYAVLPVVYVLSSHLIYYRIKRVPNQLFYNLSTFLLSLTSFLFIDYKVATILRSALSVVISVLTYNVTSATLTAIETRGVKWKLSSVEWLSLATALVLFVTAVTPIEIATFPLLPIVATLIISLSIASGVPSTLVVGGLVGLAAAIVTQDFAVVCVYFVYAIGVALGRTHPALSGVIGTVLFIGIDYCVTREIGYLRWIGAGAGSALTLALYRLISPRFNSVAIAQSKTQSSRHLINRTRQEVADKLSTLSSVFKDMEEVLTTSIDNDNRLSPDKITQAIQRENCAVCPRRTNCEHSLGESMTPLINQLVSASLERGKASILDTPAFLSANCARLSTLIDSVNLHVKEAGLKMTRDQNKQLIKDVMSRQMGGVGDILKELSLDVATPVTYDGTIEKKLVSELNYRNYLATDAIVYHQSAGGTLTLQLAEEPTDSIELSATVNRVLGARMTETKREKNVLGGVTITYEPCPKYGVTYGEYSVALDDRAKCGDNVEAAHIGRNKVMIVLSDGMGSGKNAYETSRLAIDLLTGFYKAGFAHDTVLYSSSRLLTLKSEEDFNAVDLALVDLMDGGVDFIKLGGREGYLKTVGGVDVLPCGSLPLGIVDEVLPVITRRTMLDGDYFVLVSDGVADILKREEMESILSTLVTTNPNVIAKEIVDNALRLGGKKDDMSCVVARVFLTV